MHVKYDGKRRRSVLYKAWAHLRASRTALQNGGVCAILVAAVVLVWYYIVSLILAEGIL